MFDWFCDYMYSLLYTPLKKTRESVNQFYLFFKVIGRLFDDTKKDIFRLRTESMIASASGIMLSEHGRDRNMPCLKDEPVEGYRLRLMMKAIIAEKAGTVEGLILCLESLELDGDIIPCYTIDAARWAEFLVRLRYPMDGPRPVNIAVIQNQIRGVKPASALDNYLLIYYTTYRVKVSCETEICFTTQFYPRYNLEFLRLDGTWKLDGTRKLNGYNSNEIMNFYPMQLAITAGIDTGAGVGGVVGLKTDITVSASEGCDIASAHEVQLEVIEGSQLMIHTEAVQDTSAGHIEVTVLNRLDGTWKLDGSRKLNGGLSII